MRRNNILIWIAEALVILVVASSFAQADEFMYIKKKAAAGGGASTPPTYINSASNHAYVTGTTGVAVTHGFTLANGDVLYAFYAESDDVATAVSSSGWTQLTGAFQALGTGNDRAASILRKVITDAGSEPASYTFLSDNIGLDGLVVIVVQTRGANTSTPEDAAVAFSAGSDDFTPNNVDIVTATDNALVLIYHVASCADNVAATKTAGAPSGYTLATSTYEELSTSAEAFIEVAYKENTGAAGTQAIDVWTGTDDATSEWFTYAVAVKPQ